MKIYCFTGLSNQYKLDQRDLLIDQLSQISQITVTTIKRWCSELGNGIWPIIFEKDKISKIVFLSREDYNPLLVKKSYNKSNTRWMLSGLEAYALVGDTQNEIDNLAIIVAKILIKLIKMA